MLLLLVYRNIIRQPIQKRLPATVRLLRIQPVRQMNGTGRNPNYQAARQAMTAVQPMAHPWFTEKRPAPRHTAPRQHYQWAWRWWQVRYLGHKPGVVVVPGQGIQTGTGQLVERPIVAVGGTNVSRIDPGSKPLPNRLQKLRSTAGPKQQLAVRQQQHGTGHVKS
ncbi:MAG: hypothetical protein D9N13_04140 [Ketobacter sp. GenoA1]|nr:hypothetical protein [Pseudomonadales bacterium]RLT91531.1 MAG: hypothetical protein D9N13_04140 [Ketobacter sp. GenoA1]